MRNEQISAMLAERIAAGDFPSAVYVVAERGQVKMADSLGDAVTGERRYAATLDTIYDLASLTKPLITGLLCARRLEQSEINLDDSISGFFPEFNLDDKREITLRQLLTHTSGLPAWRPLYLTASSKEEVLQAIAAENLEFEPGTHVRYSDLGFITLGFLLEKLARSPLAEIAHHEIFDQLKLTRTFFNPDKALVTEMAACELGNAYERGMCDVEKAQKFLWRDNLIWGEVHDGNAYFMGGAAGHAGLFSTAPEALRIASQFHAGTTEVLQPETCALFQTNMTKGMEEARSFGWQLAETKDSTASASLPPNSFGHLGFTGTSCWNDPQRGRTFILLTNRTHARTLPFANINNFRRQFHTLAVAALEELEANG